MREDRHLENKHYVRQGPSPLLFNWLPDVYVAGFSQNCYYRPCSQPLDAYPPTRKRALWRRPLLTAEQRHRL